MNWGDIQGEPPGGFNLVMALFEGSWGAGKSFTALATAMHGAEKLDATVLAIDSENRLGPYEVDHPRCQNPAKYKRIVTDSVLEVQKYVTAFAAVSGQKILLIDSLSPFWPAAQELRLREVQRKKSGRDSLAMNDWPIVKKWYNWMIDKPNQLGIHFLATGREEDEYEEQDGERVKVGVRVSGEKQTGFRFYTHLSFRPEMMRDKVGRNTQTGRVLCQITKDNWHQSANQIGKHWVNPTGEDLSWLWDRLQGGSTATPDTDRNAEVGADSLLEQAPIGPATAKSYARRWTDEEKGWGIPESEIVARLAGRKLETLTEAEVLKLDNELSKWQPESEVA